ncbi:hypothetical protein [Campylobacter geochelonis]|uniref:hypothetical protein n=1 Tax=Campylobacter geochelonis TaxID=1780362 RepID=UPI0007708351|nr:hypothetical protein [Campylobacter geochelonis]CZE49132.1 Uncharacterised protein [Campylobacter geochelonis]
MKKLIFLAIFCISAYAHIVQFDVGSGGVYASIFFDKNTPAKYSEYEIFAPDASLAFARGYTDARGVLAFVPDRSGAWRVDVKAGSNHGEHKATFVINVDKNLTVASVGQKPLYSSYSAMFTGLALIIGLFGFLYGFKNRQKNT